MNKQLIELCEKDSRLGFHSEAEGYKYFPEKIRWRMDQLNKVLKNDVPDVKKQILNGELLFPEYTGKKPKGPVANSIFTNGSVLTDQNVSLPSNLQWHQLSYGSNGSGLQWASSYDKEALYIFISDRETKEKTSMAPPASYIQINIEPRRLWPIRRFSFNTDNTIENNDQIRIINENGIKYVAIQIHFNSFLWSEEELHPIRVDVKADGSLWCPNNPITPRLMLGSDNPADLGWLIFMVHPESK